MLKPKIVYNTKFLVSLSILMPIGGMAIFPFIILRDKYKHGDSWWQNRGKQIINHESIHFQQQLELGVIPFYILYVLEFIFKLPFYGAKAYDNISFEKEAYNNDLDFNYLCNRKRYNWIKLIFNK